MRSPPATTAGADLRNGSSEGHSGGTAGASGPPSAASSSGTDLAWSLLSSSAPGGRSGAGFASGPNAGEGVLFGGQTSDGLNDSTLLYNESLNRWQSLQPLATPTPRSDVGFASDPSQNAAVLFGGLVDIATERVSNETWKFSFATNNWTNVTAPSAPSPRSDPAFAVGDGVALLYGGQDPNASGLGQLIYFDTWILNLSTDGWTRVTPAGPAAPGPLYGASLQWDPDRNAFLLFGGCAPCSSTVWAFSPSNRTWTALSPSGTAPPGRRDAVFAFDPVQGVDLLFGGTDDATVFNDTYEFAPASATWTLVTSLETPAPRADAAAAFLAEPGNETLLLTGGASGPTILPDTWRLAPVSNLNVLVTNVSSGLGIANATVGVGAAPLFTTNATGTADASGVVATETAVNASAPGYAPLRKTLWIPPATNETVWLNLTPLLPATLTVRVTEPQGTPIPNVLVSVSFGAHPLLGSPHETNDAGVARFTQVPSAIARVTARYAGFHANNSSVYLPPGGTVTVNLTLNPLLELYVETLGQLPGGTIVPLRGVSVTVLGAPLGSTDPEGWLNATTDAFGAVLVRATVYGFVSVTTNVTANYTGGLHLVLLLPARPFPSFTVEVLGISGAPVDLLVRNARFNVTSTSTLATGPIDESFATGVDGAVTFSVPPGNYSFRAWARGFAENDSILPVFATVSEAIRLTVHLAALPLSNLTVRVRSATGARPPIGGAEVSASFTNVNLSDGALVPAALLEATSDRGWSNFTGLPASWLYLNVSATGYQPNATIALLAYGSNASFLVNLTPSPPVRMGGVGIFTGGTEAILTLVLLPTVALLGALVYLTMLRNPAIQKDRPESTRARSSGPPAPPEGR
jgi:hypothetical protein